MRVLEIELPEAAWETCLPYLGGAGRRVETRRVVSLEELAAALGECEWDLVVSGHRPPEWDGLAALASVKGIGGDVAFIAVTPDAAGPAGLALLRAGADECVAPGDPERLVFAVERALDQARLRRRLDESARALEASEDKFRSFVENAPVGVLVADATGRHVEANRAAELLLGYGPGELAGTCVRDLPAPECLERAARHFAGVRSQGQAQDVFPLRRRDGGTISASVQAAAIGGGRFLAIVQDLTPFLRMEKELQVSEARFRSYAEHAPVAVFVADREGKYVDCNPAAVELLGWDRAELLGMSIGDILPEEGPQDALRQFAEQLLRTGHLEGEYRLRKRDGGIIWVWLRATVLPDGTALAHVLDITGRKQAEEALAASEARFRSLFEGSAVPMLEADLSAVRQRLDELGGEFQGQVREHLRSHPGEVPHLLSLVRIRQLNPATLALMEAASGDIVGRDISRFLSDGAAQALSGPFADLAEGAHRLGCELPGRGLHGKARTLVLALNVAPGHERTLSRVFVSLLDITARKQAEESLREREARYRAVVETSPDGFWMVSMDGRILEVNDAYLRRSGYSRQELMSMRIPDLEGEETASDTRARIEKIEREGSDLFETWHRARDGTLWQVEINVGYWPVEGGRMLVFLRDIQRRKRSELLLRARVRLSEISERGSIDRVIQAALDEAELHTGSRIGFFHFIEPDQQSVRLQTWSTNTLRTCLAAPDSRHYPIEVGGIWVDCLRTRAPVIHNDYAAEPHRKGMPEGHSAVARELTVPVLRDGRVVAIMGVGNKPSPYGSDDVEAVQELASMAMDVVARMRAEEALRESEKRLSLALSSSGTGVWEWDLASNAIYWSPECFGVIGIAPADFTGTLDCFERLIHPGDLEEARRRVAEAIAARTPFTCEFRLLAPDGAVHWVSNFGQVSYDESGKPSRMVGTVADIDERKRAEEALRRSEERFRSLVETAFDWVWEVDGAGRYTYASPQVRQILGYAPEEIVGKTPFDLMPAEEAGRLREVFMSLLAAGRRFSGLENVNLHRDGRRVVLETSGTPVFDGAGKLLGYRGFDRDITERKRGEQGRAIRAGVSRVLAESGSLAEASPLIVQVLCETADWDYGAIWLLEEQPRALRCVDTWQRPGLRDGGLAEASLQGACQPDSCQLWAAFSERRQVLIPPGGHLPGCQRTPLAEECGMSWSMGVPVQCGDRAIGVLELWRRDRFEPDAAMLETLSATGLRIGEFIERKRAEEQLRRFVACSPAVLYALRIEPDGLRPSWVSDNLLHFTGYRPEEASSREWWLERVHPEDRERVLASQPVPYDIERQVVEFRLRRKDGAYIWVSDEKRLVRDSAGRPSEVVGSWSDVTRKVELEEQLRQSQKMEAVGALAGGVAHDFNNLLTVINGYSQLSMPGLAEGDPLLESLREIHAAGERAAGLTRQLLAFSRKQVLRPEMLGLNRVVSDLQSMLGRVVGEEIRLSVGLIAQRDTIFADRIQLEQAILNLVINARDAMPAGGGISIATGESVVEAGGRSADGEMKPGRYVVLSVADTGSGMDAATLRRIFEPFFTTKAPGKGTGLGLSTVQGIVAQSGGHIQVRSRPGEGTTFQVYLPLVAVEAAPAGGPPAVKAAPGTESVLVVEDKADVRLYTARALGGYGYRVATAAGADEALALFEGGAAFDLVLTDLVMPGMNGKELADRLQHCRPQPRVLFMSGYAGEMMESDGGLREGEALLRKPFSPDELAKSVRRALDEPDGSPRILVADDEPSVRRFLRTALEAAGYQVLEAGDGAEAMSLLGRETVDLVLMDLVMPRQEGLETIRALHKQRPGLPIVAMSGKSPRLYLQMAEMLGADAVLQKPIAPEVLAERIGQVLARGR